MTMEMAREVFTDGFIAIQNTKLSYEPYAEAQWLDGDDITRLATTDNPDALGTHPKWLEGPAPLNF